MFEFPEHHQTLPPAARTAHDTMTSYFDLLQLPHTFAVDDALLDERYRHTAAQCHPDKFAAASAFEQKQALMMAATLNEAYRVLKNPLERAAHLLQLHGVDADAPEHTAFAPEFLMQQMAWRETLASGHGNEAVLQALQQEVSAAQKELHALLAAAFQQQDHVQAAQQLRQGRFLAKLQQEIQAALP